MNRHVTPVLTCTGVQFLSTMNRNVKHFIELSNGIERKVGVKGDLINRGRSGRSEIEIMRYREMYRNWNGNFPGVGDIIISYIYEG